MDKQRVEGSNVVTLVTTMGSGTSTEPADCAVKKRCKEKCKGDQRDSFIIINEKPVSAETGRTSKSTSFCQLNNKVIEGDLASLG